MSQFELRIGFVDSSYWDDGNRSTSTTKTFSSLAEVNEFLAQHLGKRYTFQGKEGDVVSTIDPECLQIIEKVTIPHDWRSLPCLRTTAEDKFRQEMRNIAKWGGDLEKLEKQVAKCLNWDRSRFLLEWRTAVTESGARGS